VEAGGEAGVYACCWGGLGGLVWGCGGLCEEGWGGWVWSWRADDRWDVCGGGVWTWGERTALEKMSMAPKSVWVGSVEVGPRSVVFWRVWEEEWRARR